MSTLEVGRVEFNRQGIGSQCCTSSNRITDVSCHLERIEKLLEELLKKLGGKSNL